MAIVAIIFTFLSCDDDFNSVGSEIIGDVNFEDREYAAIPVAYTQKFERVQTLGLSSNLLGVYNDPVYGQSVYSVLSQVQLERDDPTFGDNARMDSVVLNIPYFSSITATETNDAGETITTYELDSLYGNQPFRLSIYKSNYFLRDFDPESSDRQQYFSDDIATIDANFETQLREVPLYTNDAFIPSPLEIELEGPDGNDEGTEPDITRIAPSFRIKLDNDFFTAQILDKEGAPELSNANNFRNYFRGIYFMVEPVNGNGSMFRFDMSRADITLFYTFDREDTSDSNGDGSTTDIIEDQSTLRLTFGNNVINGIETDLNATIANEVMTANQDRIAGEENLYLKGGDGSYAIIDLFGGTVTNENGEEENELAFLQRQNWLVNDATLKFYINQDMVTSGETEPERVYIFNLDTGEVLIDYRADASANLDSPLFSVIDHLGRISRDSDDQGEFYEIGITQHIINVLNGDIENAKLGLAVSQNVNIITNADGFAFVRTDDTDPNSDIVLGERISPLSSIVSHEGTVLYGNTEAVPESKRLKLDIFYTESKNN